MSSSRDECLTSLFPCLWITEVHWAVLLNKSVSWMLLEHFPPGPNSQLKHSFDTSIIQSLITYHIHIPHTYHTPMNSPAYTCGWVKNKNPLYSTLASFVHYKTNDRAVHRVILYFIEIRQQFILILLATFSFEYHLATCTAAVGSEARVANISFNFCRFIFCQNVDIQHYLYLFVVFLSVDSAF